MTTLSLTKCLALCFCLTLPPLTLHLNVKAPCNCWPHSCLSSKKQHPMDLATPALHLMWLGHAFSLLSSLWLLVGESCAWKPCSCFGTHHYMGLSSLFWSECLICSRSMSSPTHSCSCLYCCVVLLHPMYLQSTLISIGLFGSLWLLLHKLVLLQVSPIILVSSLLCSCSCDGQCTSFSLFPVLQEPDAFSWFV